MADHQGPGDRRLDAPAFHRNRDPILEVLKRRLPSGGGHVLEVGSGTGQHAAYFAEAFPHLTWWPSDLTEEHLASIEAWRRHAGLDNLKSPRLLDVTSPIWGLENGEGSNADGLTAILSINVVHIAPWSVTEGLFDGAARRLGPDGQLILYGPFAVGGSHTAESNRRFDAALRAQNPEWGVRDIEDLKIVAAARGLELIETIGMPSNNFVLVWGFAASR
ncbi:MAG: class I SAM-dependent methyltransferase [Gammaproteobacteria bacterium]|nr:class I SAM-dependent methyltransferase [Gammaproteobacteria bacterium]